MRWGWTPFATPSCSGSLARPWSHLCRRACTGLHCTHRDRGLSTCVPCLALCVSEQGHEFTAAVIGQCRPAWPAMPACGVDRGWTALRDFSANGEQRVYFHQASTATVSDAHPADARYLRARAPRPRLCGSAVLQRCTGGDDVHDHKEQTESARAR
jgi:hypothetical protein